MSPEAFCEEIISHKKTHVNLFRRKSAKKDGVYETMNSTVVRKILPERVIAFIEKCAIIVAG